MTAQSCDSISTRPSTPASRIDQWLSERSKHSRPPPHLRVPSTSFVYESKGLSRSFNLPSAPKTPEIASSYLIKGVNTISEELWESFVKKFATPHTQTVEEMIDEDDEDLGSDFDDPEAHKQTNDTRNISTGWATMDTIFQIKRPIASTKK